MPLHIDLFALLIFLGIVQGLFLAYFFLFAKKEHHPSNRILGVLLFCFSLAITEIFLCYTNLMFEVIWLVDFSEPANFLFAQLAYLYIQTTLTHRFEKRHYWHFVPFTFYFIYTCLIFFPQNPLFKYNAYVGAYHPQLPYITNEMYLPYEWLFWLKSKVNEVTLFQFFIYLFLTFRLIYRALKAENLSFFSKGNTALTWCRDVFLQQLSIVVLFVVIKLSFHRDLGDHILAAHITFIIYIISFHIVRQSVFFYQGKEENKESKKYEKSSLTPEIEENTLKKLENLMNTEKPFLNVNFSLPNFAKMLNVSPHHLSQILNERLSQNFFEFTAYHRICEAKKLLASKENGHLKIEEIAEKVGYNSKSAFNTGFKRIVGLTPSEFRKEQKTN